MNSHHQIVREDNLSSWRLASLLAFNGFLFAAIGSDDGLMKDISFLVPWVGLLISISVLGVSIIGLTKKYKIHNEWAEKNPGEKSPLEFSSSAMVFYAANLFGPFLLTPIVLSIFWLVLIAQHVCK